ncbi:uncharacterized protein LOC129600686 isoform X2 [Paramacrobiotus metropolitanus]|nr:uncharacterized protein LOC129600686 isoform X2 [Paramacrobiotus metropolitanus]
MDEFMWTLQSETTTTADAAVRDALRQFSQQADELSPRQRVQLASVCQLILLDQRSRIKVLSATLTAPGELSATGRDGLQCCRDEAERVVVDAAGILQRFLTHILPQQLHTELDAILTPLLDRMQTRDFSAGSDFLSTLGLSISVATRLLAGLQGEFFETLEISATPALIRELDEVAALIGSGLFDPDVNFVIGQYTDYPASDWEYFTDNYRGTGRVMVHYNWVYAMARMGSVVYGGTVGELWSSLLFALNNPAYNKMLMLCFVPLNVAARLGGGTVYPLVCDVLADPLVPVFDEKKPANPQEAIAGRVCYRHESLLQMLIQIVDILGPSTKVQYCIAVDICPRTKDDDAFWATLYLFRRVADPRASHRERAAAGTERSRGLEADGVRLCNDDVQAMSREDLRRVFDIDLVAKHHVDATNNNNNNNNNTQPVQLALQLQYPDGSSRPLTVDLNDFFPRLKGFWEEDYRTRLERQALPANRMLRGRDSELHGLPRTHFVHWQYWRT